MIPITPGARLADVRHEIRGALTRRALVRMAHEQPATAVAVAWATLSRR